MVYQLTTAKIWDGAAWQNAGGIQPDTITGANLTAEDSEAFYYAFTSNGTVTVGSDVVIDAMWIAGGGGGATSGWRSAGGAGAGGMLLISNYSIPAGSYAVTIGGGGSTAASYGSTGGNTTWLGAQANGGAGSSGERVTGNAGGCGGGTYQDYNAGQSNQVDRSLSTGGTATGYGNDGARAATTGFASQLAGGGGGVGSGGFFGTGATYNSAGSYTQTKYGCRGGFGTELIPEANWLVKAYHAHGVANQFGEYGFIGGGSGAGVTNNLDYGMGSTTGSAGAGASNMAGELNATAGIANTGGGGGTRGSGTSSAGAGGSGALYIRVLKVRP
jgi:hypothetical protein